MNKEIILSMAQPYVRDSAITYDEFDNIYSMLSRKEQYVVVEILFAQGINLVDKHVEEEAIVLDIDNPDEKDFDSDEDFEVLYDEALFKDKGLDHETINELVVHKVIKQSNKILCSLIQEGNRQAMQDLCIKNKSLVDKYAAAYERRYGNRLDFDDLEQVGFWGLITAAQKYNISQGTSFSTYAVYWIKQAISREIMENGYAIRIPVHMMEKIFQVISEDNRLAIQNVDKLQDRIQMIADELSLDEKVVRECLILRNNYLSYASLDAPVGEEEDSVLGDFIPIDEEESVDSIIQNRDLHDSLEKVMEMLTKRERLILELRFGWQDGHICTLEEIGNICGVTRERIRQIEAKAIRKMRHPSRSKVLKPYLED